VLWVTIHSVCYNYAEINLHFVHNSAETFAAKRFPFGGYSHSIFDFNMCEVVVTWEQCYNFTRHCFKHGRHGRQNQVTVRTEHINEDRLVA
jgi:hypothetical protein